MISKSIQNYQYIDSINLNLSNQNLLCHGNLIFLELLNPVITNKNSILRICDVYDVYKGKSFLVYRFINIIYTILRLTSQQILLFMVFIPINL